MCLIHRIRKIQRYLRKKYLFHSDLKPANVVIDQEPQYLFYIPKLIDFGFAANSCY